MEVGNEFAGEIVVTNLTEAGDVSCVFQPSDFRAIETSGEVSARCGGEFAVRGSSQGGDFYSDHGDQQTVVERLSAPSAGWVEGRHQVTITVELTDRTERFDPVSADFRLEFTVEADG